MVRRMMAATVDSRNPTELIPHDPMTGERLVSNLLVDDHFVEDAHWHRLAKRYEKFVGRHHDDRLVLLKLGVGFNTPRHYLLSLLADGCAVSPHSPRKV